MGSVRTENNEGGSEARFAKRELERKKGVIEGARGGCNHESHDHKRASRLSVQERITNGVENAAIEF